MLGQPPSSPQSLAPTCSIVIRCFNEERHIDRLLRGITQQSVINPEVILVDSGSTDGTLETASRYPVKIAHIAPSDFSFGRSLNRGCALATGDIIVICSAHVYPVYKDWLDRLLRAFDDPRVALAYGKQRGNEATKYSEHQVFAQWFPADSNMDQKTFFCNNANAAVRRALWERMAYDEELTGLEDLAWAQWAAAEGHRIAYVAEAEIVHVHEETPRRIYNRYRREAIALKRIAPDERLGFRDFARLLLTNVASDLLHAGHDRVLLRNMLSILSFRAAQFWGSYRGFARAKPVTSQLKRTFYYPPSLRRPRDPQEGTRPRVDYDSAPLHPDATGGDGQGLPNGAPGSSG